MALALAKTLACGTYPRINTRSGGVLVGGLAAQHYEITYNLRCPSDHSQPHANTLSWPPNVSLDDPVNTDGSTLPLSIQRSVCQSTNNRLNGSL